MRISEKVKSCTDVLPREDRNKFKLVSAAQALIGFLDLLGVAMVGVIASLAVKGVQTEEPGPRVTSIINFFQLNGLRIQTQVAVLGLIAVAFLVGRTVFSMYINRRILYFLSNKGAGISSGLMSKLLSQQILVVEGHSAQKIIYSATTGVNAIVVGVLGNLSTITSDLTLCVVLGMGLLIYSPLLSGGSILVFGGVLLLIYFQLNQKSKKLTRLQTLNSIANAELMVEVIETYREAVVRNRRSYYASEISKFRYRIADMYAEQAWMPNISKYVVEITITLGTLLIAGIQFASEDAPSAIGNLTVFLAAGTRIAPALLRIQQNAISVNANLEAAGPTLELISVLQSLPEPNSASSRIQTEHAGFKADLELTNVSFTYPGVDKPALKNIDLHVKEGELIAVVGPSGAGKTTLIDLILGILEPTTGSVTISSLSPLDTIEKWPGALGYVPQDVVLVNGTIKSNITLGFPDGEVIDELVWDALKLAKLDSIVREFDNELNQYVGEKGSRLSGGQKQRLGIARALLTRPKFLVLDEATSSLDGAAEKQISDSIQSLHGSVTTILIAHRLSTVRTADRVVYMEDGEILAIGNFEQVRSEVPNFDSQAKLMGL